MRKTNLDSLKPLSHQSRVQLRTEYAASTQLYAKFFGSTRMSK